MLELVAYSDIAIGNEEDADKVFGIHAPEVDVTKGQRRGRCLCLRVQPAQGALPQSAYARLTLRGSLSASHNTWSGILWHDGQTYVAPTYDIVPIVDRVGGGDSFMGGLIYGLLTYDTSRKQSTRRRRLSAQAQHHGRLQLATVDEVEKLMGGDASGRVNR